MSLRSRVALLILVLFLAGMAAALMRALQDARHVIRDRLEFTQSLTVELLNLVQGSPGKEPVIAELPTMVMERLSMLEGRGYFSLIVETPDHPVSALPQDRQQAVPRWFASLLGADTSVLEQQVGTYSGQRVLLRTDPDLLLRQVWDDSTATLLSQLGTLLLLNIVIYLMLGRWLSPIERIVGGLHEMENGEYTRQVALSGLPELDQITRNVNHLNDVLSLSKAENERLQSQAISAQEHERQRLAQELHDSLGQAISAIKAVSVSIGMRSREQMPDIADSAKSIERISENAYSTVRELMSALRPAVLDELGLATALEQMVEDWNRHHDSTFCRLAIDTLLEDLHAEQTIHVYRIIQESLTNIIKHARATQVEVRISGNDAVVRMAIRDNGIGFDRATGKRGMGLWNIRDRVNLLRGKLQMDAKPGEGVGLYIEFPRQYEQGIGQVNSQGTES